MAEDEHPDAAPVGPAAAQEPEKTDRAVVVGKVAEGTFAIVRKRSPEAPLEAGVVRPMREGEPIVGEVVSLSRADEGRVFDVKVHYDGRPKQAAAARKGPARVTNEAFRDGWDAVFRTRLN